MESIIPKDLLEDENVKNLIRNSREKSKQSRVSNFNHEQIEVTNLPKLDSEISCPDSEDGSKLSLSLIEKTIVKGLIHKFSKELPPESKEEVNQLFKEYLKNYSS
jgi:hypothetical protein